MTPPAAAPRRPQLPAGRSAPRAWCVRQVPTRWVLAVPRQAPLPPPPPWSVSPAAAPQSAPRQASHLPLTLPPEQTPGGKSADAGAATAAADAAITATVAAVVATTATVAAVAAAVAAVAAAVAAVAAAVAATHAAATAVATKTPDADAAARSRHFLFRFAAPAAIATGGLAAATADSCLEPPWGCASATLLGGGIWCGCVSGGRLWAGRAPPRSTPLTVSAATRLFR